MSAGEVPMPRLSDSMEEGTVVAWLKDDGAHVERGEAIAEIESDKATSDYESELAGIIHHLIEAGTTVAVGVPIATIGDGGSDEPPAASSETPEPATESQPGDTTDAEPAPDPAPATATPAVSATADASAKAPSPRPKATPLARRVAQANGLDLTTTSGSGPGGRIVRSDVDEALSAQGSPESPPKATAGLRGAITEQVLTRPQQVVARRMSEARTTVPDFEVRTIVDAVPIAELRAARKADGHKPVPSLNDFVVKAAAVALLEIPRANAAHNGDTWQLFERINIGIAVALDDGLVVPTLYDADTKSVGQIARESRELATKAREGGLSPAEMDGGTFTISNLGMFGVTSFSAVTSVPQAAILSVGAAIDLPVIRNGEIVPGSQMELGLSCDHRILYGADGARFLAIVRERLESPLSLLLD